MSPEVQTGVIRPGMSRRDLFRVAAAAGVGAALPASALGKARDRSRVLRVAHLTDLHVQPEKEAAEGLAKCLGSLEAMQDKPGLILTGGDLVMDSFESDDARTKTQWDLVTGTFKDKTGITVEHCLGNHDIWGWNKKKSKTTGDEPTWGKKRACGVLGLSSPWRAFKRDGWRFIVIDSVAPDGEGYIGQLDEAQRAWLETELKADTVTPTLVVSHIPILSMCATIGRASPKDKAWKTPFGLMHADGAALHKLFTEAGNIKLCLSGHVHLNDRLEVSVPGSPATSPKVTYICDGAVCGAWWGGRKSNCDEGYGLVDLYDDGSFDHRYVTYGWQAKA